MLFFDDTRGLTERRALERILCVEFVVLKKLSREESEEGLLKRDFL